MSLERSEYWRLSSFYLFYFALLGAIAPYLGLFFKSKGFSGVEIGTLMAVLMGTRIVAPNLWGWLADRTGQPVRIIRAGALLTLIVFSGAFWAKTFWHWAVLMFGFSFFWNAVLPQFEAVTLRALGADQQGYSRIRLWGSVGFILAVLVLGWLFDWVDIGILVPVMWGLMLLVWLASLGINPPPAPAVEEAQVDGLWQLIKRPPVLSFFAVYLLIQLSHGPYYSFYSIYMSEQGYDKTQIGLLWALGVVAEVLMFWVMHRLLSWTGLRAMVQFGMAVSVLRWLMIGLLPEQLWAVLVAQLFHAVTFGCLHAAGIALVHHFFPASHQGQGQALYSSLGFGVGGSLGAFLSGWIWSQYGGSTLFVLAAATSLLGWLLAWRGLRLDK
ncbi:MAG: PPP family 3-phenylpropionic acid transporter [Motiliproteus sp.]|jgi:PPP family 3-phenylpropionic acid transporter